MSGSLSLNGFPRTIAAPPWGNTETKFLDPPAPYKTLFACCFPIRFGRSKQNRLHTMQWGRDAGLQNRGAFSTVRGGRLHVLYVLNLYVWCGVSAGLWCGVSAGLHFRYVVFQRDLSCLESTQVWCFSGRF